VPQGVDNNTQPFLIILFAALALSYLSFTGITFINGKSVDMFSEVRKDIISTHQQTKSSFIDSLNKLLKNNAIVKNDSDVVVSHGLEHFLLALNNLPKAKNKIRIAWFGDSMIEGDLVTNDFRKLMQKTYGGNGVGYVGVTSPTAQFRGSINHTFSGWKTYSFHDKPPKGLQLGMSGYTNINSGNAKVKYTASKEYNAFGDVRLLFNSSDYGSINVQADTFEREVYIDSTNSTNTIVIWDSTPCKKLMVDFNKTQAQYYGMYFDNGSGVYVDNFSFRGNSGIPLSEIPTDMLQKISNNENYQLVVLNYGLNIVAHNQKNYDWYERAFKKTLAHIKQGFPNSTIVLMSVSDKSYRNNGVYETEPDIPKFVELQKKMAQDAGISFWNLYEAMGGKNSMKRWVEEKPRLANYDYTHPNFDGAKKIATLFYNYLQTEYNAFTKQKKLQVDTLAKINL
jgi:lysophospholipase L1-like esterase